MKAATLEPRLRESAVLHLDEGGADVRVVELVLYEDAEPDINIPHPLILVRGSDGVEYALFDDGGVHFTTDDGEIDSFRAGTWNCDVLYPNTERTRV